MSTKALIDRIVPYAKGWSRTGTKSILHLIQEGQDELLNSDEFFMRFISTDNQGFPPYLYTTDGTYRYEITNANLSATLTKTIGGTAYTVRCRNVISVFVDTQTDYDYVRTYLGEPYIYMFNNPYRQSNDRVRVAKIPVIATPALEDTATYVDFPENPGTSTDIYFIEFTWEAPRLTAETIPLCVPQLYESALEDYVIGKIEMFSNGKMGERLLRFYGDRMRGIIGWIDKFRSTISGGAFRDNEEVQPIFC